jgi:hypothetical protein
MRDRPPPSIDPTVLTTAQLDRGLKSERDFVEGKIAVLEERLNAIDRATRLLNETVNRTPTEIQKEVSHLRELMSKEIDGIRAELQGQAVLSKDRLEGIQRETKLTSDASEQAIAKAEVANEKRFESMDRLRAQLAEQTNAFLPREVAEAQFLRYDQRISDLTEKLNKLV